MNLDQLRDSMKMLLMESRYIHSVGVEEVSFDLALIHGYDTYKASIAGILHDCARNKSDQELIEMCNHYNLPVSEIEKECAFLLHGKVGATIARELFDVQEDEILNAIIFHTTGKPAMTLLEKIIFTADYIEPNRKPLPRIDMIREAAYQNLDYAVYMILENTITYLNDTGAVMDTLTVDTYDYYKTVLQKK
jgi:predicted HD superfamily hydrolase involved in NAD metabolism